MTISEEASSPMNAPVTASSPPDPKEGPWTRSRLFAPLVYGLLAVGFISRLLPLFNHGGRLLRQFPTEDGYLTLQIARNMALGLGMSVSEGTIPTNGTQPFCTFVWSLAYRLVGADKTDGVFIVLVLEFVIAAAAAYLLYQVGRKLWEPSPKAGAIAALGAAAWYSSPAVVPHSMNCLESGTYALAVLVALWVVMRNPNTPGSWSTRDCLVLGATLGWVFWVRNDAVFLILGVCLAHWLVGVKRYNHALFGKSLLETIWIGATSVVVATPWMVSNYLKFGHLMPISGIAESHQAQFGQNLHLVAINLFEYVTVYGRIPKSFESNPLVIAAAGFAVIGITYGGYKVLARHNQLGRPAIWVVAVYALGLSSYYGLYFGASHFVSRYLFPLSSVFTLVWAAALLWAWESLANRGRDGLVVPAGMVVGLLAAIGGNSVIYAMGKNHMHFQVVEWVNANVDDDTWVGAIQTGTLGYYHDRTYNLDGKVNPHALEAKLEHQLAQYVLDRNIRYLVDWIGIAGWMEKEPLIGEHFELTLNDRKQNLAVLSRVR